MNFDETRGHWPRVLFIMLRMPRTFRTVLLFIATALIGFAAWINATVAVPHLHEDLTEINVRPTLMRAVLTALHFTSFSLVAFAGIALVAAVQSGRGVSVARVPLLIMAALFISFGVAAFVWGGSYHTLGYIFIGALLAVAGVIRQK